MDPRTQPKFFDVARPSQVNPSANSRPVIVGHQPMMVDPMVRGAPNSVSSPATVNNSEEFNPPVGHTAKVVQISDEMKNELATTAPESPLAATPNPAPLVNPSAIGEVPPNIAAQISTPKELPVAPNESATAQTAPIAAQTLVPAQDLSHLPHIPVSHSSASGPGKFKHMLLWLAVIAVLGLFAAFLLIDAGLVGSSVKLPFHLFSRQS